MPAFPCLFVVLGMGQKIANEHRLRSIVDSDDQAILVSGHVEYRHGIAAGNHNAIGMWVLPSHFLKAMPVCFPGESQPIGQKGLGARVALPVLPKRRGLNDPHGYIMYPRREKSTDVYWLKEGLTPAAQYPPPSCFLYLRRRHAVA